LLLLILLFPSHPIHPRSSRASDGMGRGTLPVNADPSWRWPCWNREKLEFREKAG